MAFTFSRALSAETKGTKDLNLTILEKRPKSWMDLCSSGDSSAISSDSMRSKRA
jgi:hypothetical protein